MSILKMISEKQAKSKVKKTQIIVTLIIMAWLSSIKKLQDLFHTNYKLKESFNEGGIAGDYAQYAYILLLMILQTYLIHSLVQEI